MVSVCDVTDKSASNAPDVLDLLAALCGSTFKSSRILVALSAWYAEVGYQTEGWDKWPGQLAEIGAPAVQRVGWVKATYDAVGDA